MKTFKSFVRKNAPNIFFVRFSLDIIDNSPVIVGEIVMCDALNKVLAKSGMLKREPALLHTVATELQELQPPVREFYSMLELLLHKIPKCA